MTFDLFWHGNFTNIFKKIQSWLILVKLPHHYASKLVTEPIWQKICQLPVSISPFQFWLTFFWRMCCGSTFEAFASFARILVNCLWTITQNMSRLSALKADIFLGIGQDFFRFTPFFLQNLLHFWHFFLLQFVMQGS